MQEERRGGEGGGEGGEETGEETENFRSDLMEKEQTIRGEQRGERR